MSPNTHGSSEEIVVCLVRKLRVADLRHALGNFPKSGQVFHRQGLLDHDFTTAVEGTVGHGRLDALAQIQVPAWRFHSPAANVAAVIGPEAITPESKMPTMGK